MKLGASPYHKLCVYPHIPLSSLVRSFSLVLILILAAYLRLAGDLNNLGWYADEGTHVEIAKNLVTGRVQYMVVGESMLLFARLPLFDMILAGLFRIAPMDIIPMDITPTDITPTDITTLRLFTGVLGSLTVVMLYGVARRISRDSILALSAAFLFAIYPRAIIYSRFGFSYNLLAPLLLLVFLGMWGYVYSALCENRSLFSDCISVGNSGFRHNRSMEEGRSIMKQRGWLSLAALAIGVGGVSDLWMFSLVAPFVLIVAFHQWRDLVWSLPLITLPFAIYAGTMLVLSPQAFVFDLIFTATRLSGIGLLDQFAKLAQNYMILMTQDPWMVLGVIGLMVLPSVRARALGLLLFLLPILVIGRTEALFHLSAYYMIPLLPLVCLGLAGLMRQGLPILWQIVVDLLKRAFPFPFAGHRAATSVVASLILFILVGAPFLLSALNLSRQLSSHIQTEIDPFLVDAHDARRVASYLEERLKPSDLVIASPAIAWQFDAHVADFQMVAAAEGRATPHLPANLPPSRFAITPSYATARYVVVDNTWHRWAIYHVPGVDQILSELSSWSLVLGSGDVKLYCNAQRFGC